MITLFLVYRPLDHLSAIWNSCLDALRIVRLRPNSLTPFAVLATWEYVYMKGSKSEGLSNVSITPKCSNLNIHLTHTILNAASMGEFRA